MSKEDYVNDHMRDFDDAYDQAKKVDYNRSLAKGIVGGTGLGGLVGYVAGGPVKPMLAGAVTGAGVGTLAGMALGNASSRQFEHRREVARDKVSDFIGRTHQQYQPLIAKLSDEEKEEFNKGMGNRFIGKGTVDALSRM